MLVELHGEIASRTREIARSQADWPCKRGCDTCCRRLAELPRMTRAEWELVEDGLSRLPGDVRSGIDARLRELKPAAEHHICPFLERNTGSCLIYDQRPVACRTYGFYVERDRGLYCGMIEARVNSGDFASVVWGNVASVDARLEAFGEKITMLEWFNDSPAQWPRPLPTQPSDAPGPCGVR